MNRHEKVEQIRTPEELTSIFDVDYIKAVQTGMAQNYKPMEKILAAVIRKTLRVREQQ